MRCQCGEQSFVMEALVPMIVIGDKLHLTHTKPTTLTDPDWATCVACGRTRGVRRDQLALDSSGMLAVQDE